MNELWWVSSVALLWLVVMMSCFGWYCFFRVFFYDRLAHIDFVMPVGNSSLENDTLSFSCIICTVSCRGTNAWRLGNALAGGCHLIIVFQLRIDTHHYWRLRNSIQQFFLFQKVSGGNTLKFKGGSIVFLLDVFGNWNCERIFSKESTTQICKEREVWQVYFRMATLGRIAIKGVRRLN